MLLLKLKIPDGLYLTGKLDKLLLFAMIYSDWDFPIPYRVIGYNLFTLTKKATNLIIHITFSVSFSTFSSP